jgi:hypothetical protein
MTVALCYGSNHATEVASEVMAIYGEKLKDYLMEFNHA